MMRPPLPKACHYRVVIPGNKQMNRAVLHNDCALAHLHLDVCLCCKRGGG